MTTAPIQGLPLHTRSLTVWISRDGEQRWRARGDVIDLRKNGFVPSSYDIQPSGVIHNMSIELVFDPVSLRIDEIAVDQPFVAIEPSEATGGECCRDPAPILLAMNGETLDRGFTRRLGARFGGALGCSHLLTLFQLMASTLPRAAALERARAEREGTQPAPGERFFRRSLFIDGFEHDPSTIDVAIQLADTHSRPLAPGDRVTRRLALSHEVKTFAAIDRKRFRVREMGMRERQRSDETLATAPWVTHDERVASLVDVPLIPGMAGRIFAIFGEEPHEGPFKDSLLQLAPAFIQITAALMDEYFERAEAAARRSGGAKPGVASIGGNTNSCYMWREDGRIARAWPSGKVDS